MRTRWLVALTARCKPPYKIARTELAGYMPASASLRRQRVCAHARKLKLGRVAEWFKAPVLKVAGFGVKQY
jgi:hypothetical protein